MIVIQAKDKLSKMKIFSILVMVIIGCSFNSCSSDDGDVNEDGYPKTVNITFEIITTRNSEAIITRTLNNDTQIDNVTNLPYSFTYAQEEVNRDAYLKLTFIDNGTYVVTQQGSSFTDYDAELKISVGNEVVKTETFSITEGSGLVQIDYTFE